MLSVQEFVNKYVGKPVEFNNDQYKFECWDLVQMYIREVVGSSPISGNAKDLYANAGGDYVKIPNTPSNFPIKGDIVVWGTAVGPYGHTAIALGGDANSFTSFDQNWPLNVRFAHHQAHNYSGVTGWLRPKGIIGDLPPLPQGWNSADYLTVNPDVAKAGVDPIYHWQHYGFREGRKLHPDPVVVPPVVVTPPVVEPPVIPPVIAPPVLSEVEKQNLSFLQVFRTQFASLLAAIASWLWPKL